MGNWLKKSNGSSLVTVTVIMTVIGISLSIFLRHVATSLPSFPRRKETLQRIANSRSGVLKGIEELKEQLSPDTSAINKPLWEDEELKLWKDEQWGEGEYSAESTPFSQKITSMGAFKQYEYSTIVDIDSRYTPGDTVVILFGKSNLEASNVSGTKVTLDSTSVKNPLQLNERGAAIAKAWISEQFKDLDNTLLPPITINSVDAFKELEDTIKGPLFIDGAIGELKLDGRNRELFILGDLQVTGDVNLKNLSVKVAGEIRLNDRSKMINCLIIANKRVFVADECNYSGKIASLERIEIYGASQILNESLIVSFDGKSVKSSSSKQKDSTSSISESSNNKTKSTKKSGVGAINIREQASVSGTIVTLGSDGIMTEIDSKSDGIFWSKSWIRHQGNHKGILRALLYKGEPGNDAPQEIDPAGNKNAGLTQPKQHEIIGSIESPFEAVSYPLPWFIGESHMSSWVESNK